MPRMHINKHNRQKIKELLYRKNFGGKDVWQIKTVECLAEKIAKIEVHLQSD